MNKEKMSLSWCLIWGVCVLLGGLVLFKGYQYSLTVFTPKRINAATSPTTRAVTAIKVQETGTGSAAQLLSVSKSPLKSPEINCQTKRINVQEDPEQKKKNIKEFPSPVKGRLLRDVGNYYSQTSEDYLFHAGKDYAEPEGSVIRATHGGKVVSMGLDPLLGQQVTLDCGDGWLVTYGGLDNLRVRNGETVVTQEALGQVGFYSGEEGESGRPQLHYEVWHNNDVQRPE